MRVINMPKKPKTVRAQLLATCSMTQSMGLASDQGKRPNVRRFFCFLACRLAKTQPLAVHAQLYGSVSCTDPTRQQPHRYLIKSS